MDAIKPVAAADGPQAPSDFNRLRWWPAAEHEVRCVTNGRSWPASDLPPMVGLRPKGVIRGYLSAFYSVLSDIHLLALAEVELAHRDGFQEALF
jgi:hypothetical protein